MGQSWYITDNHKYITGIMTIMSSFDEIETLCQQADMDFGAAESHGILSGLICSCGSVEQQHWLALLYENSEQADLADSDRGLWNQIYETALQQLAGDDLDFQLLLPDDDQPLSQRTEALADWCRGFLYGISAGNLKPGPDLPDDVNEIIQDLTQISRASYDEEEEDNEGENAYVELAEYIRAGTMLIYTELQAQVQPSSDRPTLH